MEANKKLTKWGRRDKNYRKGKSCANADLARAGLLSMKLNNTGFFSKIDLSHFTDTFFPQEHLLPYSRLSPLPKLLVCQYVLHNYPVSNTQSIPFVFRLSPELEQLNDRYLKKKIQRKLSSSLQRTPLYWLTTEYDTHTETRGKHLNGEILLYPGELEKCKQAFKELFGLHEIDSIKNQPILNVDGSIKQKKALRFAIDFPIASRTREAKKRGEFYAIYNWPSYSMKQRTRRQFERSIKNSKKGKESFYYVSEELSEIASKFYSEHIYNNSSRGLSTFNQTC